MDLTDTSQHTLFRRHLDLIAGMSGHLTDPTALGSALREELELAARIQANMRRGGQSPDGGPILGVSLPAQKLSGDFFDMVERKDGLLAFAIGDVAGKGFAAGQLMAVCSSLFRRLAHSFRQPGPLLSAINAELCRLSQGDGRFVSMVAGFLHPISGCLLLANAGHQPAMLHRTDGHFLMLRAGSPPLGIDRSLVPPTMPERLLFLAGGCLYLYTDGVTECRRAALAAHPLDQTTDRDEIPDFLGERGLRRMIGDTAHLPPTLRMEALLGRLADPISPPEDDMTLMMVSDQRPLPLLFRRAILEPSGLSAQRHDVEEAARAAGLDDDGAADVVMAIDEACQNILRHGYGGPGPVVLEIIAEWDRLVVHLIDFAPRSDLTGRPDRPLAIVAPGGLGLPLMRQAMDSLSWQDPPPGTGNFLRMTKALP